jgi:hypothetical protein
VDPPLAPVHPFSHNDGVSKVRENDGGTARYSFLIRCFLPRAVFLCFLCFRRSGPPALRVEKKKPQKNTRAPCYTRGAGPASPASPACSLGIRYENGRNAARTSIDHGGLRGATVCRFIGFTTVRFRCVLCFSGLFAQPHGRLCDGQKMCAHAGCLPTLATAFALGSLYHIPALSPTSDRALGAGSTTPGPLGVPIRASRCPPAARGGSI